MSTTTAGAWSATVNDQPEVCQLRRSGDDRMLAGVAGGIARYLDVDVTLVRVIIAALALLNGAGLALYIAAWLLIPEDGQDQSLLVAVLHLADVAVARLVPLRVPIDEQDEHRVVGVNAHQHRPADFDHDRLHVASRW